jgi:hypothetical protein
MLPRTRRGRPWPNQVSEDVGGLRGCAGAEGESEREIDARTRGGAGDLTAVLRLEMRQRAGTTRGRQYGRIRQTVFARLVAGGSTALMRGRHIVGIGVRHRAELGQQQCERRDGGNAQFESTQEFSQCRPLTEPHGMLTPSVYTRNYFSSSSRVRIRPFAKRAPAPVLRWARQIAAKLEADVPEVRLRSQPLRHMSQQ